MNTPITPTVVHVIDGKWCVLQVINRATTIVASFDDRDSAHAHAKLLEAK